MCHICVIGETENKINSGYNGASMSHEKWATTRIQAGLKEEVEKFIEENPQLGYHSLASFIADAVRRRLEDLERLKALKEEKLLE